MYDYNLLAPRLFYYCRNIMEYKFACQKHIVIVDLGEKIILLLRANLLKGSDAEQRRYENSKKS